MKRKLLAGVALTALATGILALTGQAASAAPPPVAQPLPVHNGEGAHPMPVHQGEVAQPFPATQGQAVPFPIGHGQVMQPFPSTHGQ